MKNNNGDGEPLYGLLKRKVPIHCEKDIKFLLRLAKQFAVLKPCPPMAMNRDDLVLSQITRDAPINTFVEKNLQGAVDMVRFFASSRNAITCSRVTDGNPSRKSSMLSPASM